MEKKPFSKLFSGIIFYLLTKIFAALLKTYELQNGDMEISFLEVFQKSEMLKNAISGR